MKQWCALNCNILPHSTYDCALRIDPKPVSQVHEVSAPVLLPVRGARRLTQDKVLLLRARFLSLLRRDACALVDLLPGADFLAN